MSFHDAQIMFVGVMIGFFGFMAVDLVLMIRARRRAEKLRSDLRGPNNNPIHAARKNK